MTRLQSLQANNPGISWRITEAWPPHVNHSSLCHLNGGCVDINFLNRSTAVADVVAMAAALRAAGLPSFQYESPSCAAYTAAGVLCRTPATMTAPSFHVNNT